MSDFKLQSWMDSKVVGTQCLEVPGKQGVEVELVEEKQQADGP